MHRYGRNVFGNAGAQGDHARDIGGIDRLGHAPENDLIDPVRIEARSGQQRVEGDALHPDAGDSV